MGLLTLSSEDRKVLLTDLQGLYDRHRYLDAYQMSAGYWDASTQIEELSAEELILAGRLAARLGGFRLSRHLFRNARDRDPELPVVRYFTRFLWHSRDFLLDQLRDFEENPELGGNDADLRASWLTAHAYIFATLRDFSKARDLLKQAHALSPGNAWIWSQEADIHGMADDWARSLASAEQGCRIDPRSPWPVLSLATALLNQGEIERVVSSLATAAADTQFYQLVQSASWYCCAHAEVLDGEDRKQALERARLLAERMESLAPLADKEFKNSLARTWLDISTLADDHAAMEYWSQQARSPFHRKVLANLRANPNGKRIRLPYRRTIQKHVECVPTSIASALSATGVDISLEELARDVTFGGTWEWAAADWLKEKGLHVRFFSATAETVARFIEAGIGFAVSWDDDESGHTVAIVGIDHAAGTVIVHDPASFRSAEYLLSSFKEAYGPLSVPAMAAVRAADASKLDALLPPDAEVVEATRAQQKALMLYGASAARPIVEALEARFPNHSGTRYLRAIQLLEDGRVGKSLGTFRELLKKYPNSPSVRVRLIAACRALGDTGLLRETLRSVVDTGKVPGIHSQSDWTPPHHRYFYEYADLLRSSAQTRSHAESLLRIVLRSSGRSAGAWHILADLRWRQEDTDSALLAYRIAATIAEHNEHYAGAYADALCRCGRIEEGLEWLSIRAESLGKSLQSVSPWITYVSTLEDWGNPDKALETCRHAIERFPTSPSLLTFAVPFLARMGQWEEARKQLQTLENSDSTSYFHEAAVYFHQMRGATAQALKHAEAWVQESPLSLSARNKLLSLTDRARGRAATLALASQWMRERPENEDFEEIFCRYCDSPTWRALKVLKGRVKRNPDDGWAWRELAFTVIPLFESADEKRRLRLTPKIAHYLAQANRVAADDAATLRVHALWHEAQGNWPEAHSLYLQSIQKDPGNSYSFRRAFAIASRFSEVEQREMWAAIEPVWLESAGHLPNCLEIMRLLDSAFGPRETERIIEEWQKRRPDDPNVAEAMADLLLEHGHGRSDAVRSLGLLRPAVERYPYNLGLRYSLARAFRAVGDSAGAEQVFEELVHRRPDNLSALIQLAWIRQRRGETDRALDTLKLASEQEPQSTDPLDARVQMLIEGQRYDEALEVLEEGLRKFPESVRMYEIAIERFAKCGDEAKAVEAARQGVRVYPFGAYMWLLLGRTLRNHPKFAAPGEIEQCLRRSLKFNRGLYESADWLAMMLTEQRKYDDATQLISSMELRTANPSAAQGRKAWITRKAGKKREAVTDLAECVRQFRSYEWGWDLLLTWLEEDKDWELSKQLLDSVPPQMISNVSFRWKRLLLLEKAKVEAAALDAEWQTLLEDFPEDVSLYLYRYDSLRDAGRWEEASAILAHIEPIGSDDVYLKARLVDVKCHEGNFAAALKYAIPVCFAPVEQSVWPVNHVWEILGKANKENILAEPIRARMESGSQPTPRAFSRYAEYILDQQVPGWLPKRLRQTPLNPVRREIIALMRTVNRSAWRADFSAADFFSILNKHKYPRLVVRFWKEMSARGDLADGGAWAEAGSAMVTIGQKRLARELFKDWRSRQGVKMWSLANYMQCLSRFRKQDLQEVVATCKDALANLRHDHCARYLTFLQAEALALMNDKAGLMSVWSERSAYFEGTPRQGEYFRNAYKYLLHDIPDLVEALQKGDRVAYGKLRLRLYWRRSWNQDSRRKYRRFLIYLLRVLVILWITGMMQWLVRP